MGGVIVQLSERSRDRVTNEIALQRPDFSNWRYGKAHPTLGTVRSLVKVLQPFVREDAASILRQEDIDALIRHSGFTPEQLSRTAREVIRESDEMTADIHPLLKDIRNAADVSVTADYMASSPFPTTQLLAFSRQLIHGFEDNKLAIPNADQVRELMGRYSHVIQERGHEPLGEAEIDKVVRIAERARSHWQNMDNQTKISKKKPREWRTRIVADIDSNGRGFEHGA